MTIRKLSYDEIITHPVWEQNKYFRSGDDYYIIEEPGAWQEKQQKRPELPPLPPESQWFGAQPIVAPPALIKGVLPQTGVAGIVGQSGSGKTFHAIHLATRLIPDCKQDF
jgi:hypothetical protein